MAATASYSQHNAQPFIAMLNVPIDKEGDFAIMRFIGSNEAINSFVYAFDCEGLTLPLTFETDGVAAFEKALIIKMETNVFPSAQDMDAFMATQVPSLGGGIEFDGNDDNNPLSSTPRQLLNPPVSANDFDIDDALLSLRDISRADTQGRIYDLGIITQCPSNNAIDVVLLPSCPRVKGTYTVWLFRRLELSSNVTTTHLWSTLVRTPKAQDIVEASRATTPSFNSSDQPTISSSSSVTSDGSSTPVLSAAIPIAHAAPSFFTNPTAPAPAPLTAAINSSDLLIQPDSAAGGDYTDEEILSGKNGFRPKDIKGDILLRLALSYSNAELASRLEILYKDENTKKHISNLLTKRLTKAFVDRAKLLAPRDSTGAEIPLATLRAQFDNYRKLKKLRSRAGRASKYDTLSAT